MKNKIYLIRFGRTSALLLKKKGHEMTIFPVLGKLTHMLVENLHADILYIQAAARIIIWPMAIGHIWVSFCRAGKMAI